MLDLRELTEYHPLSPETIAKGTTPDAMVRSGHRGAGVSSERKQVSPYLTEGW